MDEEVKDDMVQENPDRKKATILPFPVVCIGASAGGLEALQEFFRHMPAHPGAAFVVIQHLSPDYKSLMDELLARCTPMVIHRVEDGMRVSRDHIYLIPPRKNMTILHGKLLLSDHAPGKVLNLPIDIFLRSLARDQEKNAIGIILSGTGSDGTLGIRAIKESGGIAMAQDDRSAKFDGMPRSTIATGIVDFILPPAQLADELVNYIKHPFISKGQQIEQIIGQNDSYLSKIVSILRDAKGVDFSEYKPNTIIRRLEKRISINRFSRVEEYIQFLAYNSREIQTLFNEMLIGVTRFFRDEESFHALEEKALPVIFRDAEKTKQLRIWVAGCSTGEEAYSLAILFTEYKQRHDLNVSIKIFATDLDSNALEYAGTGVYPESVMTDISPERLSRFFIRKPEGYRINESIRSMIIFARHDVLNDPPFTKINLISCRNMLIYFNTPAQQKVLSFFYLALTNRGYLFLGSSESVGPVNEGFSTEDSKNKIYRQRDGFRPPQIPSFGTAVVNRSRSELHSISTYPKTSRPRLSLLDGIFDEILGDYVPPSVIVDESYEIVHTIHQVGRYLSIPVGQVSLNLLKMMPKELAVVVSSLLRRASKSKGEVAINNITLESLGENELAISCRKILDNRNGETFFLVSFQESEGLPSRTKTQPIDTVDIKNQYMDRIDELEKELQFKSESLQATVEELETSNEELQSSNEELIASNEELQSTNEELQSVNEELYTVNSEHIRKIEDLTELTADMENLLTNTGTGTLFLDRDLLIRKINSVASELTHIRTSDTGRPIQHISLGHLHEDFVSDVEKVMTSLQPREREVQSKSGRKYLMSIVPYRTAENAVNGTIITFVDITSLKCSEERIHLLYQTMKQGVVFQDADGAIVEANKAAEQILGLSLDQMKGLKSVDPHWRSIREDGSDLPGQEHPSMRALATGKVVSNEIMGVFNPKIDGTTWIRVNAIPLFHDGEKRPYQVYATFEEISVKKPKGKK